MKAFFVDALSSALDLGIATPDDVLAHATPDVLANHLPRPLWARLLTACVGAPRVDAQLVIETIGVPNLCEHVPAPVVWACLAEVGARSLGGEVPARPAPSIAAAAPAPTPLSITSPPPPDVKASAAAAPPPAVVGPSIPSPLAQPMADLVAELEAEDHPASSPLRSRTSTSQRFRQSNTNIGRLAAANQRRPQAQAIAPTPEPASAPEPTPAPAPTPMPVTAAARRTPRRGETEIEEEVEIEPSGTREDWRSSLAVEDEQLVEWSASEETQTSDVDDRNGRKR